MEQAAKYKTYYGRELFTTAKIFIVKAHAFSNLYRV
jgi:hypothetical protein